MTNIIDIAIIVILGASLVYGLYRGFVHTLLSVACCLVSVVLAFMFGPRLSALISGNEGVSSTLATYTDAVARVGDYNLASLPVDQLPVDRIDQILSSVSLPEPIANILSSNLKGKVFAGQAVGATGSELSFQTLVPGQDSGFLHTHKTHEELYIILKGEGQYQVDGEIFPVSEGTIVRVAPDGKRALKNTGSENLTMLCIQYKANAFTEADSPMTDGVILQEELKW